ncbi:MAG: hypothetical protein RMJ00_03665 [Nitrososphaerota archaeon]|nr:hypothetical protein [Candidatus Bathyarchaeota archaeon]MCX8162446.1 hypothetical protein [Candidatus Bathyarchaeota archaeon]MDW8061776.1 hypothetical protein [Nitrososphaerota archaeon]
MGELFRRYMEAKAKRYRGFIQPPTVEAERISLPEFYMGRSYGRFLLSSSEAYMLRKEIELLTSTVDKLRFYLKILIATILVLLGLLLTKAVGVW